MIINSDDNDFSGDDNFSDEARKLLKLAEAKSKISSLHQGYDNPCLQLDDSISLNSKKQSNDSSNSENLSSKVSNSSLVQRVKFKLILLRCK